MFKYLLRCLINFTLCAAVIGGAAAACGFEYRLVAVSKGEAVVSYEKLNEDEGRLTLGKYTFTLDLNLLDGVSKKLTQYMDSAVAYLPELAIKAGGSLRDIALKLGN